MSMLIDKLDFYEQPNWYDRLFDHILDSCREELNSNSSSYQKIEEQCNDIIERYEKVEFVINHDPIREPTTFSEEEQAALFQYLKLDSDSKDLEAVQMYLLGCRHTLQMLQFLEMI